MNLLSRPALCGWSKPLLRGSISCESRNCVWRWGRSPGSNHEALRFALTAMVGGTCLAGGEITIDETPGLARCLSCDASVEITSYIDACSRCGSYALQATGGTELRIVDLLVVNE